MSPALPDPGDRVRTTAPKAETTAPAANPWPETATERAAFQDWQHEAANGDTAASFRSWLAARDESTPTD